MFCLSVNVNLKIHLKLFNYVKNKTYNIKINIFVIKVFILNQF